MQWSEKNKKWIAQSITIMVILICAIQWMKGSTMSNPTKISYTELQTAYDLFNKKLFDGALPNCLLTLQPRDKRIAGYFSSKRFEDIRGQHTDELAMNPTYFHSKPIEFALQTLGHEMAHVWQFHHGNPGRRRLPQQRMGREDESDWVVSDKYRATRRQRNRRTYV